MANGFVEVSGYSATDLANARTAGYNECKEDLETLDASESRTYDAEEMGVVGWNRVEAHAQPKLISKVITANGFYDASDDDHVDGYSSLEVAVPGGGGGGPFTVRFFADDRQTILKTDANVPYDGNASCTLLDGTILNGLYFKGWNPAPTNVRENMNCYPVRGDYVIDPNEIQDDWETICADCGAHYPLGSYKSLVINLFPIHHYDGDKVKYYASTTGDMTEITFNMGNGYADLGFYNIAMHMVKVAEGEDGSTSSWLSTGCVKWSTEQKWIWTDRENITMGYNPNSMYSQVFTDWGNSLLRQYMQEEFLSCFPEILQTKIKAVNKAYTSFSRVPAVYDIYVPSQAPKVEKTSLDRIWIPSLREFHTLTSSLPTGRGVCMEESTGIDYSAVYAPNYWNTIDNTARLALRSAAYWDVSSKRELYAATLVYNSGNLQSKSIGAARAVPFGFCL